MAIRAAFELLRTTQAVPAIVEENPLFEIRAADEISLQALHLLNNKTLHLDCADLSLASRELGVVRRQAAQKCAHVFGAAMRQSEFGIRVVKVQIVARTTVSLEGHFLEERASGRGLMTERAVHRLAAGQQRNVIRLHQMA